MSSLARMPMMAYLQIRIGIFTIQDICPLDELTYDYQFEHFGVAEQAGAYM